MFTTHHAYTVTQHDPKNHILLQYYVGSQVPFFFNVGNETETRKEENSSMGMNLNLDIAGADSDLSALLNAWYAAGFYTGR